jgi:hypothetical protein
VGKPKPFSHFSKRHVATPKEVMLGVRNNGYIQNGLYINNTLQQLFLSIIERKRQKNDSMCFNLFGFLNMWKALTL